MNLDLHFRDGVIADAEQLVERLRKLAVDWAGATAAEDRRAARRDTVLAVDLIDHANHQQLRAAVLVAVSGARAPIPVVLGPQDAAAVVGLDEILGLLGVYAHACTAYGRDPAGAEAAATRSYVELKAALERLCLAATVVELDGLHGEGRLS